MGIWCHAGKTSEGGTPELRSWELALAFAARDALRSGYIYPAESRRQAPVWNLVQSSERLAGRRPGASATAARVRYKCWTGCERRSTTRQVNYPVGSVATRLHALRAANCPCRDTLRLSLQRARVQTPAQPHPVDDNPYCWLA
jgi:hypothetical protein